MVAVGAIGVAHIGWRGALGAAEHVVAISIARVEQAENIRLDFFQLGTDGHSVRVGNPRPPGTDRQLTGTLHGVVDGGEYALLLQQGVADGIDVAAVLVQQCLLLLQQEQTCSTNRIIGGGLDTNTRRNLIVGLVHAGEVLGVATGAGLIELSSGNTHDSLLLTKR
ncbi:hypothetical protein D3C80_1316190 [compost metagenome]